MEAPGFVVALRSFAPGSALDEERCALLRNQVLAGFGISHPNVIRTYEYMKHESSVAYTTEFMAGRDLAHRLAAETLPPLKESINILAQICAGLQAIHDAGYTHRDLRPEKILFSSEGAVKISHIRGTFTLSQDSDGSGGIIGTIDYIGPEYLLTSKVDHRSDIYALGVLAFEMISGALPFKRDSIYSAMTNRLKVDPPSLCSLRADCPATLEGVVLKALAREPKDRYQTAEEMSTDLLSCQTLH